MKKIAIPLMLLVASFTAAAQQASLTDENDRSPIKGLTKYEFESYRDGKNMNYDRVAELNHYPGPANVLKLSKELKLDPNQIIQLKEIDLNLQRKVLEMGAIIIAVEKKIDDLFRERKVTNGSVIYQTQQYGLYQGELRNAYLQAHLKTRALLSAEQVKKYDQLLGY